MFPLKPVALGAPGFLLRFPLVSRFPFPRPPRPLPPRPPKWGVVAFDGVGLVGSLIFCVCQVSGYPGDFLTGVGGDGDLVAANSGYLSAVCLGFVGVFDVYPISNGKCSVGVSGEAGVVGCFLRDVA